MNNSLQLCSFEQSKLLKELGFDWETYMSYTIVFDKKEGVLNSDDRPINHNLLNKYVYERCSAPTIQLALKWLRDIHNIYTLVEMNFDFVEEIYDFENWEFTVCYGTHFKESLESKNPQFYNTYEEAESAALDLALGYLKEKL